MSKQAQENPSADDFVKRDHTAATEQQSETATKEKTPTAADIVSDSNTSVEHLAEIVRAANAEEEKAKAEIEKANAEEAKKKAEEERKKKEQEAFEAKMKEEQAIKANEALGDEGMQYLQSMAQNAEKEKVKKQEQDDKK